MPRQLVGLLRRVPRTQVEEGRGVVPEHEEVRPVAVQEKPEGVAGHRGEVLPPRRITRATRGVPPFERRVVASKATLLENKPLLKLKKKVI